VLANELKSEFFLPIILTVTSSCTDERSLSLKSIFASFENV